MADEMMRVAARSDAGVAKALRADEHGNIGVRSIGAIGAETKNYLPVLNVKETWVKRISPSAVFAANGHVYVGIANGHVIKSKPDGTEVWRFVANHTRVNAIFVDDADNVYIGLASREVIKLDSYARVLWRTTLSGPQLPAEGVWCIKAKNGYVYLGHKYLATNPHVIKMDAASGAVVYYMTISDTTGGWEIYDLDIDGGNNIYAVTRLNLVLKLSQSGIKQSVVNVSGITVTRTSGDAFTVDLVGQTIQINGTRYTVASFTDASTLTLTATAANATAAICVSGGLTRAWTCVAHTNRIRQIKLGVGGYFYTCSDDAKVRKWDQTDKTGNWGTGQQLWSFDQHSNAVICLVVDPAGNVYSGGLDAAVYKTGGQTGAEAFKYVGQHGDISGLAVLQDYLYSVSNDGTIRQITNELQFYGYKGD